MAQHRHHQYEEDIIRLRERILRLEREVNGMKVLQSAARLLLGLPPEPPPDE